jgi:hypothetical protein
MNRMLIPALAAVALSLSACATPRTTYQPAASSDAVGWRETKIETDRYRVSFRANSDARADGAETFALRRAAEIALRDGADWFRVVRRSNDQVGLRGGGSSVGVGGSSGSYGSSVGVGLSFDLSGDQRQWDSVIEILLGRGAKPSDPDAYDARSLLNTAG